MPLSDYLALDHRSAERIKLRVFSDVGEKHDEILGGIAGIKEALQGVNVYLKTKFLKEIIVLLQCREIFRHL